MTTYNYNRYDQQLRKMNKFYAVTAVILAVLAVVFLLWGLMKLFERSKSDCVVELSDGTVVKTKSCISWSRTNVLSCDNHKKYSLYAVKSWECK
jgi:flagellar biogenesis protein FliO